MWRLIREETRKIARAFLHPAFLYLVVVGNAFLILSVAIVYFLEKDMNPRMNSFFDTLWWGVSTITTVGYGDIVPITTIGRIIGILVMYVGTILYIAFISILVITWMKIPGSEISRLEKEVKKEEWEQSHVKKSLEDIKKRLDHLEKKT